MEFFFVFFHEVAQGTKIAFHAAFDLFLADFFGFGGAEGAFEGEFSAANFFDGVDSDCKSVVGFEDMPPHAFASDFDLLGEEDFAVAGQQWDVAHLTEIHADGIAGRESRGFRAKECAGCFFGLGLFDFFFDGFRVELDIGVFDEVEAFFVEGNNEAVYHGRVAAFIREPAMCLLDRNKAALPASFDDRLQSRVQTIHANPLEINRRLPVRSAEADLNL